MKDLFDSIHFSNTKTFFYNDCHLSKQTRLPFLDSQSHSEFAFDLMHCDIWEKYSTPNHDDMHFFFPVDDFSRITWIFLMKNVKREV